MAEPGVLRDAASGLGPAELLAGRGSRWHRPAAVCGVLLVGGFAVLALGAWMGWLGQGWAETSDNRFASASAEHWWGTNLLGQDIWQRSVYSVRTAFELGLIVSVLATLLGTLAGAIAGWRVRSPGDEAVVFLAGVLDSIPFYLFVAALAYALAGNAWAMHFAMIATFWTTTARLIRAEVMRLRAREFVQAALAMGLPSWLILARHVLPNTLHIALAQLAIVFVSAIKAEVILSFLGLGVQDGVSWGVMLAESTQEILAGQFNNLLAASLPLFALLLGFNLLVDTLQDAFDPRQGSA